MIKSHKNKRLWLFVGPKNVAEIFWKKTYNKNGVSNDKGIFDKLINSDIIKNNIQSEKNTQGTATPTCIQVDYENIKLFNLIYY